MDGRSFSSIGRINNGSFDKTEKSYEFEDSQPARKTWYRVKQVKDNGNIQFSKTVLITRKEAPQQQLYFAIRSNLLNVEFNSDFEGRSELLIINFYGQQMLHTIVNCKKGANKFNANISSLPAGNYLMIIKNKTQKISNSFIKMSSL